MSIPCKFERSILSYEEHEIILRSHHPEIYDAKLDDLKALRQRLRDMRDKERTLARENRRALRGKGASRGGSFPGTAEHPLQRKQVFAAALKRVSKEIGRMQKLDARTEHIEARAAHWPCVARLRFLPVHRPEIRPGKVCVRHRTSGGGQEWLLPRSAGFRKPRRMRRPLATPATGGELGEAICIYSHVICILVDANNIPCKANAERRTVRPPSNQAVQKVRRANQ